MNCKNCFNVSGAVMHWNTCDSRPLISVKELAQECVISINSEMPQTCPEILNALEVAADVTCKGAVLDKSCMPTLVFNADCLETLFNNGLVFNNGTNESGVAEDKLQAWITGNACAQDCGSCDDNSDEYFSSGTSYYQSGTSGT